MSFLTFSGVTKSYGTFKLGPLDITVTHGVTALLGANGAGKTTLLRIAVGSVAPENGSVSLDGQRLRRGLSNVGYLPQDFSGPKNVRVRDYLRFIAWCRSNRTTRLGNRDVDSALELVDLSARSKDKIGDLSGGMVRRIGIAQALLGASDVIVLDEPTVGLDPLQRRELRILLEDLGQNRTLLISTHLSEDVAAVATQVVVLHDGTVAFDGSVDELCHESGASDRTGAAVEAGFLARVSKHEVESV